jgi:PAP2 superfamily
LPVAKASPSFLSGDGGTKILVAVPNVMLSWQQAALLAAGLFVAGLLLVRLARACVQQDRPPGWVERWAAHIGPFAREAGVVTALYALWQLAGNLAVGGLSQALAHAWWIWRTERSLGLPSELSVQHLLVPHPLLAQIANLYYATMHFGVLIAMLVWLFVRHRDAYPAVRNAMAASTAICLLVSFIPVAPPRMLSSLGFVDLAARYGESVYGATGAAGANVGADQLSAMPSVHVCWSVLVAWAVITASTSRWRWLILAHPIVTVFVVVGTGNHYWADGIVSVAIVAVVLAVQALLRPKLGRLRGVESAGIATAPPGGLPTRTAAMPTRVVSRLESTREAAESMAEEKESSQP